MGSYPPSKTNGQRSYGNVVLSNKNPKTFLISDLHIGHTDIHIKWRKEFSSQTDHDEAMVRYWNAAVRPRDTVKVLGDFVIGLENLHYISELNGHIHWFLGNHDPKITRQIMNAYPNVQYCASVMTYKNAVLSHVPIHPIELEYRNWSLNIHGHQHENKHLGSRYYNVNADVMGYHPREFHSIMQEANRQ